jgi:hypothetical protein
LSNRSGIDAAVLAIRTILESNPGHVLVSLDGIGAYDHIHRAAMLERLAKVPGASAMSPFVRLFYERESKFLWKDETGRTIEIKQADGGEQGDALMPALFALGIQGALEKSAIEMGEDHYLFAYLDDVYVIAPKEKACEAFQIVSRNIGEKAGVKTHLGKLQVWGEQQGEAPPGFPDGKWQNGNNTLAVERGIKVLGSPLGTAAYVQAFCTRRVEEKEKPFWNELSEMCDPQVAWLLTRYCAEPRFNHLLRNVPPSLLGASAELHDRGLRSLAVDIFKLPENAFSELAPREIMAQPGRNGGCGLRLASRTAVAAYWAGWAAALPLIAKRFPGMVEQWRMLEHPAFAVRAFRDAGAVLRSEGAVLPPWEDLCRGAPPPRYDASIIEPGEFRHGWQFYCSDIRESNAQHTFFQQVDHATVCHLWSQAGPGAAAFLTAKPDDARRLFPAEFQIAIRRRLHLPILVAGATCPGTPPRSVPLDPLGDHLCSCTRTGRIQRRALPFERAWIQVFREAGVSVRPKPLVRELGLVGADPTDRRQLDFFWRLGLK